MTQRLTDFLLRLRGKPRATPGQGLVEFALILPILLLLFMGSIEMGRLMVTFASLSSASRQAARYGSVNGDRDPSTTGTQQYALDCAGIRATAKRAAFLQGLTDTQIFVGYDHGQLPVFATCVQDTDPSPALVNGDRIVISVTTTYEPIVPLGVIPPLPVTFVASRTYFRTILGPTPTTLCVTGAGTEGDAYTSSVRPQYNSLGTDNVTEDQITVTLRDRYGCAVPSKQIQLTQTGGPGAAVLWSAASGYSSSPSATTDSNGEAIFKVRACTLGTYEFTATDLTDSPNVVLDENATIYFVYGAVDASSSTLSASPTSVDVVVPQTSTITASLKDGCDNAVGSSKSLELRQTSGPSPTIDSTNPTTSDGSGVATWSVSSIIIGTGVYSVYDATDAFTLTNSVNVRFTPGPVVAAESDISASPPSFIAGGTSTIDATLRDVRGNVIEGATTTLSLSSGPGTPTITAIQSTSDASGNVQYTVQATTKGDYQFALQDTGNPSSEVLYVNVHVDPGPATTATTADCGGVACSSIAASPAIVLADDADLANVLVKLRDQYGNGVDDNVTLSRISGSTATIDAPNPTATDYNGTAAFTIHSAVTGTATFSASGSDAVFGALPSVSVDFVTAAPSPTFSTVTTSDNSVVADNSDTTTILVTLYNGKGVSLANVVTNTTVALASNRGAADTVTAINAVTDSTGIARFNVRSAVTGTAVFSATVTGMASPPPGVTFPISIVDTETINFTVGPPSAATSVITATPTSLVADNTETTTITMTVLDAQSRTISGASVTLSKLSGPAGTPNYTGTPGATNASGVVVFTARTSTAGDYVFRATATTALGSASKDTSTITFNPGPVDPATSTVTASASSINSNGTSVVTITVRLKDAGGNDIPGKTVSLAKSSGAGTPTVTTVLSTTNSSGQAFFTVKSLDNGSDAFQATTSDTAGACNPLCNITQTAAVRFSISESTSTVVGNPLPPATRAANNNAVYTMTVTLRDGASSPVSNTVVSLTGPAGTTITAVGGTTSNASGVVTFTVKSSSAVAGIVTATDTTDGITVLDTEAVNFINTCVLGAAGASAGADTFVQYSFSNSTGSTYRLISLTLDRTGTGGGDRVLTITFKGTQIHDFGVPGDNNTSITVSSFNRGAATDRDIADGVAGAILRFNLNNSESGDYDVTTTWQVGAVTCSNGPVRVTHP